MNKQIILLFCIMCIGLVSAQGLMIPTTYVINVTIISGSINSSNTSDFWDDLNTPADISGSDINNDLGWINASDSDTNESTRFNSLTGTDCTGDDKMIGVQNDGTVLCGTDQIGGTGLTTWLNNSNEVFLNSSFPQNVNFTGNLTLGDRIIFRLGEIIDNLVDGWITITGNLNVTGILEAENLTVTDHIETSTFHTNTYLTTNNGLRFNFYDDGTEIFLNVSGGDAFNINGEESVIKMYKNPVVGNDYRIVEFNRVGTTIFAVVRDLNTLGSFFPRSLQIGGTEANCSGLSGMVGCDADVTGSDLLVQDEIWTGGGAFFANGSVNITDDGNVTATGSYFGDGQNLNLAKIGQPIWKTIQDIQNLFHSSGVFNENTTVSFILLNSDNTFNVTSGSGTLRATNNATATLLFFDWSESNNIAIALNEVKYVGIEYNAGSPQVVTKSTNTWDSQTEFVLGSVIRDASGVHLQREDHAVGDHANNMILRLFGTSPFARDERTGGLIIGTSGRNITLTSGIIWEKLNQFTINAIDTSSSDTFDRYYRNGTGGWFVQLSQTTWNNTHYDDGTGTLNALGNNKYGVEWIYLEVDNEIVSLYGQEEFNSVGAAEASSPPSTAPDRITLHAKLIGRIIFQKDGTSSISTESVFVTVFTVAGVTDVNNLANIDTDFAPQYLLTDGTRGLSGNWDVGNFNLTASFYFGDGSQLTNLPTGGNLSWNQSLANSIYLLNSGDSASGNYNFDDGTLFIDAGNNRIGIGTTPSQFFHMRATGNPSFMFEVFSASDNFQPRMQFVKSASATKGTYTDTADGEALGQFLFNGVVSSALRPAAEMSVFQDGAVGSNVPGKYVFRTSSSSALQIDRLSIDSAGLINIPGLTASSDVQTDANKNLISTSDSRLKNDIGVIEVSALDVINQIIPRYFSWKNDDNNNSQLGFYAEEMALIIPEAAPHDTSKVYDVNGKLVETKDVYGFNSRPVLAFLIKAVQELKQENDILKLELCGKDNSYSWC